MTTIADSRLEIPHLHPLFTQRTLEKLPWVTFRNPNFKTQILQNKSNSKNSVRIF